MNEVFRLDSYKGEVDRPIGLPNSPASLRAVSEIVTFYSYKGGVGRTMALANISVVLSRWGHRVLVVDWDLEAPGLEHFYGNYIDNSIVETKLGIIDLLQLDSPSRWQDEIISIKLPSSEIPIHLITSGKRNSDYFKKVRAFNVDAFYEQKGGEIIEKLRNEWLANYDYVLIDSRTGITEIGGICTIQLPDTVVMLFTATNQGFEGTLDIINRAAVAQQKLPYDRQKLIFLPVPSKFETNTEFKLSQNWLRLFAQKLESAYNDWLPITIDKKDFLEFTKIPYIAYFSFGEKLAVIEQGVKDPSGLGYAYENIAAMIANRLNNIDILFNNRDRYIDSVNRHSSTDGDQKKVKTLTNTPTEDLIEDWNRHVKVNFGEWENETPLEPNRVDVFLFGVAASGKSCLIAGLLNHGNVSGNLDIQITNVLGFKYAQTLIRSVNQGFLPPRTPVTQIQHIDCELIDKTENRHPFNIIEMSGEIVTDSYAKIVGNVPKEFTKLMFQSKNNKILLLCLDYNLTKSDNYLHMTPQQDQLEYLLKLLEENGILNNTLALGIIVTKWDCSSNQAQDALATFLSENFLNLINLCKDYQKKYGFEFWTTPFSLGNFDQRQIYKYDHRYSQILFNWLCTVSPIAKVDNKSFFKKILKMFRT